MAKKSTKAESGKATGAKGTPFLEVSFEHEKETKTTNRFKEVFEGERGLIGSIYLKKPLMAAAATISVKFVEGVMGDVSNPESEPAQVCFALESETKRTYRYNERDVPEGQKPIVGSIYIHKDVFKEAGRPADYVNILIEG